MSVTTPEELEQQAVGHDVAEDKDRSGERASPKEHPLEAIKRWKPYFPRYVSDWQNILEENRVLRFVAISSLAVTLICLGILLSQGDRTRTIVVPMAPASEGLYITGNEPSDAYLQAIARDVIGLIGTFTGSSAQSQFDRLLIHVHPSVYNERRTEWANLARDMRGYRDVTFATYVRPEEPILMRADVLRVPTQRVRFIGATRSIENGHSEIGYLIENGRFWLTSYDFIPKGQERVSKAAE
jgi:conjugal transfer pilus assembly protein TraE